MEPCARPLLTPLAEREAEANERWFERDAALGDTLGGSGARVLLAEAVVTADRPALAPGRAQSVAAAQERLEALAASRPSLSRPRPSAAPPVPELDPALRPLTPDEERLVQQAMGGGSPQQELVAMMSRSAWRAAVRG